MKEEILTESEKEAFEKYINFMLQNGFKKEEFEFTKMPNPGIAEYLFFLRVRIRDCVKTFNVGYGDLKGMALGQTYTWKELGLYASKDILSDKEREYLSAVIKPFRDKVESIYKEINTYPNEGEEYIVILLKNEYNDIVLPNLDESTMYAGMEKDKKYTLKELGL